MKFIDEFLNKFTMYQITLYSLISYLVIAGILSLFKLILFSFFELAISAALILSICYITNLLFAKIFHAATNLESVYITALILILIVPANIPLDLGLIVGVSVLAISAKYLPTINKQHILNPAAAGVAAYTLLFPNYAATWWVGTPLLFIPVVIGGFLIVRKAQRGRMVLTFLGVFFTIIAVSTYLRTHLIDDVFQTLRLSLTQTASIFFATIMLTEPLTSPSTKKKRTVFAIFVSVLYATPQLRLLGIITTPELALLLGNIFSYIISPKDRLILKLVSKKQLSPTIFSFEFKRPDSFHFKAGQYMEWTLPHAHPDSRGNRRFLSIASSPLETQLLAVIRYYTPPSSYKKALLEMRPGDTIIASNLSGDFMLPNDLTKPMIFIAGGVGITPFVSMIEYIVSQKIQSNITLFFINKKKEEIVFSDLFNKAKEFGVETINIVTEQYPTAKKESEHFNEEMLKNNVPDYKSRICYISGPQLMVQNISQMLKKMGVKKVVTDFFPGYTEK